MLTSSIEHFCFLRKKKNWNPESKPDYYQCNLGNYYVMAILNYNNRNDENTDLALLNPDPSPLRFRH